VFLASVEFLCRTFGSEFFQVTFASFVYVTCALCDFLVAWLRLDAVGDMTVSF
jgi:hypothetical protein